MAFYKSIYTGTQIDEGITNANEAKENIETLRTTKQDTLESGVNIKTINSVDILGSGNIEISGGGGTEVVANNGEATTDTLSTLKVSGTNYAIPQGTTGDGVDVIDISLWFTDSTNGTVPTEYRDQERLKNAILKDTIHYKGGYRNTYYGDFNTLGYIIYISLFNDDNDGINNYLYYSVMYINSDRSILKSGNYKINPQVKSAQIIDDEGKLELITYDSENNPVDVNESPNEFLQRRLDKHSGKWSPAGSVTLTYFLTTYAREKQIVSIIWDNDSPEIYYILEKSPNGVGFSEYNWLLVPLGPQYVEWEYSGIVLYLGFQTASDTILGCTVIDSGGLVREFSQPTNSIIRVKIY